MRSSRLAVPLSTLAFIASQANLALMLFPLHPSVFALQLSFTSNDFWNVIALWGDSGVAVYRDHFAFDNIHPFIYGTFGYLLAAKTSIFQNIRSVNHRILLMALPIAGAFDLAENAAHMYLMAHQPGFDSPLVALSAVCSLIKWGLAVLFAAIVALQILLKRWANPPFRQPGA
jgi:hypothetical protein